MLNSSNNLFKRVSDAFDVENILLIGFCEKILRGYILFGTDDLVFLGVAFSGIVLHMETL